MLNFKLRNILRRLTLLLVACSLAWVFLNAASRTPEGLQAIHVHTWTDLPLHMAIVKSFAIRPLHEALHFNPLMIGVRFTYPFLTHLPAALLVESGVASERALCLTGAAFVVLLVAGLYRLAAVLLSNAECALTAVILFFLSSGAGALNYFRDVVTRGALFWPDQDYSKLMEYRWYGGNALLAFLLPQRAFLGGMTLGAWGLYFLVTGVRHASGGGSCAGRFLAAGILIGLLPITHMHTLLSLAPVIACVMFGYRAYWRKLLWFAVPAFALALTFYLSFIAGGVSGAQFMGWKPGWIAGPDFLRWLKFWLQAFGLAVPLAILSYGMLLRTEGKLAKLAFGAAFLLFLAANLIQTQPLIWDNSKLFLWSYFFFSCLNARLLFSFSGRTRIPGTALAVMLGIGLTATGILDLTRLKFGIETGHQVSATAEIELGEEIAGNTRVQDVFLTGPAHNHFVMIWTARPIVAGYLGWAANFGIDGKQRMLEVRAMYKGGPAAEELLDRYGVKYVVIGPAERSWAPDLNEPYFASRYAVRFANQNYKVYDRLAGSASQN